MPRTPQKGGSVRLSGITIDKLRKLSKRIGLDQKTIISTLLDMCIQHDLLNKDWQERLTAALERGRRDIESRYFESDPDRCPAIARGEERFKCVWGRVGKPPFIRLLEKEYEDSKEICASCKRTLLIDEENRKYVIRINELENKLQHKANQQFKAPVCNRGAILTNDGLAFKSCPARGFDKPVDIKTWCKVYNRDTPCYSYAEILIGVAEGKETSLGQNL